MLTSTHYNLKIVEGTDLVNPLVVDNPNYEAIDAAMYANAIRSIPTATEIKSGTVHAITRSNPDAAMFRFTATSDFVNGDTFTVDGVTVSAYTTDSQPLSNNCFRIGVTVLACLVSTVLTVFVSNAGGDAETAENALKLGGELPDYYATAAGLTSTTSTANSAYNISRANQTNINNLTGRVVSLENRQNISMSLSGTTLTITG